MGGRQPQFTLVLRAAHGLLTHVREHFHVRRLCLVFLLAAFVQVSSGVAMAATREDRGIIVGVRASFLAIREIDGTRALFVVRRLTMITRDGHRVRLRQLRRGDVALVEHVGRVALAVRAVKP